MYKLISCIAILFVSLSAGAQKSYTVSKDPENGSQVYKGRISFADLSAEPGFTWFAKGEAEYKPDSTAIGYLRATLPKYTIVTVMGTWCEDSQNLVPKLAKTLRVAQYPMEKFLLYGADRSKQTAGVEAQTYKIQLVPTIIVFRGNEEVGRITETVKRNIETDLAQIVQKAEG
jgi:hypothetical protein